MNDLMAMYLIREDCKYNIVITKIKIYLIFVLYMHIVIVDVEFKVLRYLDI
jgi:hypothetical protein